MSMFNPHRPDKLVRLEPVRQRRPHRRDVFDEQIQEDTRLPSGSRPKNEYKRRKNIWYSRRERDLELGDENEPELGNVSGYRNGAGNRNWSVAERVNRLGGIKKTDFFNADGTISQPFSSEGDEAPDRQTKWEAREQFPRAKYHFMPRINRKHEVDGRLVTSENAYLKVPSTTAGEVPHKRKINYIQGHDQRTGVIYFPVDPRTEQAQMRLAKNRALENRNPAIFLNDSQKDQTPFIEQDVSRLRKMETLTPQKPKMFSGIFQLNMNDRDDMLAHNRIFETIRKIEAHQQSTKAFPQKPTTTTGYDTHVADVHITHNKLPTTFIHERQYELAPVSYGNMPGREVDVSKGGLKIQDPETQKILFGTDRFDPILARNPGSGFRLSQLPISGVQDEE